MFLALDGLCFSCPLLTKSYCLKALIATIWNLISMMIYILITLDLLPLGMERSIIKDADITGSGAIASDWYNARLFNIADGLCVSQSTLDLYLKVHFTKLITVNAVAMQGDIATYSFNRLTYRLLTNNGSSNFEPRGAVRISSSIYFFPYI